LKWGGGESLRVENKVTHSLRRQPYFQHYTSLKYPAKYKHAFCHSVSGGDKKFITLKPGQTQDEGL